MTSPYINTKLSTSILLQPHQMNNHVYINLKKNLEKKVVGKCYSKYGYITKIMEIIDYKDGVIEAENVDSSALYDISFSCRLCLPLENTQIICEIDRINKQLITVTNGPILIIITSDRVNTNIFGKDANNVIRYKSTDGTNTILKSHDFVKVTLQAIKFYDGDEKIKGIGFMENMATDDEIKKFYLDLHKENEAQTEFNKYIKRGILPTADNDDDNNVDVGQANQANQDNTEDD